AIEKFGLDATRLMAIQYSVSLNGFKQLVATDERFMIPKSENSANASSASSVVAQARKDVPADAEKRRLRRERQEKEREEKRQAELQRRIARNRV
ncbi:MAG: hypothetical protein EBQ64_00780, partial [Acidimicrobiia bacterium]|nr:hypothetical protein [Acidimicrobiia bacterium]